MAVTPVREVKGFTLIELLVVMGIITLLAGMLLPVLAQGRERAREAECMSNVKNVCTALEVYNSDYEQYPKNLLTDLLPTAGSPDFFYCPFTKKCYEKFYVQRGAKRLQGEDYILGCPYHRLNTRGVSAFAHGAVQIRPSAKVTWNGVPIGVGDEVSGGVLGIQGGSTVTLVGGSSALVVASILGESGHVYSVFRAYKSHGSVQIQPDVATGDRCDVVTPGAAAGGNGGDFGVKTSASGATYKTEVQVNSGSATLAGAGGAPREVATGETAEVQVYEAACQDDP